MRIETHADDQLAENKMGRGDKAFIALAITVITLTLFLSGVALWVMHNRITDLNP